MPVYAYKGLDARGKEAKGLLDAESPKALRQSLKRDGIRIVEHRVENKRAVGGKTKTSSQTEVDFSKYFERVSVADIALTTRQLATLLKSGITLINALEAIVDQLDNELFKRIFSQIKSEVNEGSSLADAMAKHDVFSHLYISMVRAGEASGALDTVLTRVADFTENEAKLKSKILGAMMYPAIMLGVGSIIMVILFVVVIPKITKIFDQVDAALPIQTQIVIGIADLLTGYWFILLPLAVLSTYFFLRWKQSEKGRPKWHAFTLSAPVLGKVVRLVAISRFSRTLATLLRSGVPVLQALDITKDVMNNDRLSEVVTSARDAIREGESISEPLKKSGEFPPIVTHMISVGEQSGQLETMLEHVADNYDFQVEQRVQGLTALLEPLMIVGMGVGVAFIVFAILMPILQLSQHMR